MRTPLSPDYNVVSPLTRAYSTSIYSEQSNTRASGPPQCIVRTHTGQYPQSANGGETLYNYNSADQVGINIQVCCILKPIWRQRFNTSNNINAMEYSIKISREWTPPYQWHKEVHVSAIPKSRSKEEK